jgi:hypothetical protein
MIIYPTTFQKRSTTTSVVGEVGLDPLWLVAKDFIDLCKDFRSEFVQEFQRGNVVFNLQASPMSVSCAVASASTTKTLLSTTPSHKQLTHLQCTAGHVSNGEHVFTAS